MQEKLGKLGVRSDKMLKKHAARCYRQALTFLASVKHPAKMHPHESKID
jgi:hypothetical protein